MAYHSYVQVILALSPKMAPISKKRRKKGFGTPPIMSDITYRKVVIYY